MYSIIYGYSFDRMFWQTQIDALFCFSGDGHPHLQVQLLAVVQAKARARTEAL